MLGVGPTDDSYWLTGVEGLLKGAVVDIIRILVVLHLVALLTSQRAGESATSHVPDDLTTITIWVAIVEDDAYGAAPVLGARDPSLVGGMNTGLTDFGAGWPRCAGWRAADVAEGMGVGTVGPVKGALGWAGRIERWVAGWRGFGVERG